LIDGATEGRSTKTVGARRARAAAHAGLFSQWRPGNFSPLRAAAEIRLVPPVLLKLYLSYQFVGKERQRPCNFLFRVASFDQLAYRVSDNLMFLSLALSLERPQTVGGALGSHFRLKLNDFLRHRDPACF
jgi:hypothetical protein